METLIQELVEQQVQLDREMWLKERADLESKTVQLNLECDTPKKKLKTQIIVSEHIVQQWRDEWFEERDRLNGDIFDL